MGRGEQGMRIEASQDSNKSEEQGEDLATIWQHHLASKHVNSVHI